MRIGPALEREAYRVAREVHEGRVKPSEAIALLEEAGINRNSARDFIYILKSMLDGEVYKRAMSTGATDYFLQNILANFGPEKLANAITALRRHISYKGDPMPGYLAIAEKYESMSNPRSRPSHEAPEAQILPMSADESGGQSIVEVQEEYFLHRLPFLQYGSYRCYTTITAPLGSIVLFQYDGKIIATARLIGKGTLSKPDADGYTHELLFDTATIRAFEPIAAATISRVWPAVKRFNLTRWKLDPRRLPSFEHFVRNIRTPRLPDDDAAPDFDLEGAGYAPTGLDTRIAATSQIQLRRGQQKFRQALLRRYDSKCLVTGSSIVALLEAAHISPFRGDADNHVENGLLLRADIHTLFDLNLVGIEPDTLKIELHPKIVREYGNYTGQDLRCPPGKTPSKVALSVRHAEFLANLR